MAFPSNLFPLHFKCKLGSNGVLNPKAHSEDLRLHSSGSTQCLQSTRVQQSLYGFCRWSICSISYLKRPSGWWSVQTTNQLHWMTGFVLPHKSQTEKQPCKVPQQWLLLRSNSHIYLFLPIATFCKFQHSRLPVTVRTVISHQGQALLTRALGQVKTATSCMATPDLRSQNKLQEWNRWTASRTWNGDHMSRLHGGISSEILWDLWVPGLGMWRRKTASISQCIG